MAQFRIRNKTRAPRVIYNADMAAVTIQPGATSKPVELSDPVANELRERREKGWEEVELLPPNTPDEVVAEPAAAPQPTGKVGLEVSSRNDSANANKTSDREKEARSLIDQVDALDEKDWMERATAVLGPDFPKGKNVKKSDVVDVLTHVK